MSGKTIWQEFSLTAAVAALRAENLLAGLLLPGETGLVWREATAAPALAGEAFVGARLDSRLLRDRELFVALPGEKVDGRQFAGPWVSGGGWVLAASVVGADPLLGAPCAATGGVLLSNDPQRALAVLARVWRNEMPAKVVAVTGTNGKTTTKDFLAAALGGAGETLATVGNFNNALGLPLTLLAMRPFHRFAVIEMGASAVGEIDYLAGLARPTVGVITNAAPAHLAEFGSLSNIIVGKGELLEHLPADGGCAVLNADSPGWSEWVARAACPVVSLGTATGDHRWSQTVTDGRSILTLDGQPWDVPLPGSHNAFNLAAAILAARAAGASDQAIAAGIEGFTGSAHRGLVLEIGGRIVLDDCYNANPTSMVAAARMLCDLVAGAGSGRAFAVLGRMAELGPDEQAIHRQTGRDLAGTGLDIVVAVGAEARPLSTGFDAEGGGGHYCAAVAEAARWLGEHTQTGDHILIKGSRSAAMEEIIPLLESALTDDGTSRD